MKFTIVKYKDWVFEVDYQLTKDNYDKIGGSGSDGCDCSDCKNYIAYRDNVFPEEVQKLFYNLGIDYRKEVEILSYEKLYNGLHNIGGWFHFKGRVLTGKDCRIFHPTGGHTLDLTPVDNNFSIGFYNGADLTYFTDKDELVQIEFMTSIPWVIDDSLETDKILSKNIPTAKATLLSIIKDYQLSSDKAVRIFKEKYKVNDILEGWHSRVYEQTGKLINEGLYFYAFHGIGLTAHFKDKIVDFDFEYFPAPRHDGFDLWRLTNFIQNQRNRYPDYEDKVKIEREFNELIKKGVIAKPKLENSTTLYFLKETLNTELID